MSRLFVHTFFEFAVVENVAFTAKIAVIPCSVRLDESTLA